MCEAAFFAWTVRSPNSLWQQATHALPLRAEPNGLLEAGRPAGAEMPAWLDRTVGA